MPGTIYTSERQALYYELAKAEGVLTSGDIYHASPEKRRQLARFIEQKNKEIIAIIANHKKTKDHKAIVDWVGVVSELRKKGKVPKYFGLKTLQKIVKFERNKTAFARLGVEYDDIFALPQEKVIKNRDLEAIAPPRIEKLMTHQTDEDLGFAIEWVSNAIDAMNPSKSIGRFGEGFFQSLREVQVPGAQISISTKKEGMQGFDVFLQKGSGTEVEIGTLENNRTDTGTSIKMQKYFDEEQQRQLQSLISRRFKTNTSAIITINGKVVNNVSEYTYMNGESLDMSDAPTIQVVIDDTGFQVIDTGVGMDSQTIAKKLLYPNTTTKKREKLSGTEIKEEAPKETKFFFKTKQNPTDITRVYLQVGGVVIEDFEAQTIGNIGEFTYEFPSFSGLNDSRNQVELTREVVISLGASLEKVQHKSSSLQEKLSLLEVISQINERLKERATNEVEDEFILGTVMREKFYAIQQDLETQGIKVLPARKELSEAIGQQEGVVYLSDEFVKFSTDNLPNCTELSDVSTANVKGSISGNTYRFFQLPFSKDAESDYLIFQDVVLVNTEVFIGKNEQQISHMLQVLNVSINLNTGYELESEMNLYGHIHSLSQKQIEDKKTVLDSEKGEQVSKNDSVIEGKDEDPQVSLEERERVKKEVQIFLDSYGQKCFSSFDMREDLIDTTIIGYEDFDVEDFLVHAYFSLLINDEAGWLASSYRGDINIKRELLQMLLPFMKKKSETITKPFLKFLSYVHARVGIKKILQYTTTLIQILDRDPKTALEIMARFDDPKNSFVLSDLERLETMKQRHAELLHDGKERSLGGNYYIDSEDSLLGEGFEEVWGDIAAILLQRQELQKLQEDDGDDFDAWEEKINYQETKIGEQIAQFNEKYGTSFSHEFKFPTIWEKGRDFFRFFQSSPYTKEEKRKILQLLLSRAHVQRKDDFNAVRALFELQSQYDIESYYPGFSEHIGDIVFFLKMQNTIFQSMLHMPEHRGLFQKETGQEGIYLPTVQDNLFLPQFSNILTNIEKVVKYKQRLFQSEGENYIMKRGRLRSFSENAYLDGYESTGAPDVGTLFSGYEEVLGMTQVKQARAELLGEMLGGKHTGQEQMPISKPLGDMYSPLEQVKLDPSWLKEILDDKSMDLLEFSRIYHTDIQSFEFPSEYATGIAQGFYEYIQHYPQEVKEQIEKLLLRRYAASRHKYDEKLIKGIEQELQQLTDFDFKENFWDLSGFVAFQKKIFEQLIVQSEFQDLFHHDDGEKTEQDVFSELTKKYPQDIVCFAQFLHGGGEFLGAKDLQVPQFQGHIHMKLTDLIGLSTQFEGDMKQAKTLAEVIVLAQKQKEAMIDNSDIEDEISGTIIAQDEVGMLFLREQMQNARDAILRAVKRGRTEVEKRVEIDFYSVDNHFVSSITDGAGMNIYELLVKFLVPNETGKEDGESTGMFGKGAFTLYPSSKEVRIKTSNGSGKVWYASLTPIKKKGVIVDFDISLEEKEEVFTGTVIERIDEAEGINGNFRAMIGTYLMKKYVGNIDDIEEVYNHTVLNKPEERTVLYESEDIIGENAEGKESNLGKLRLIRTKDRIERYTKDNLWISGIKDDLLADLPTWMVEIFKEERLTIDIPQWVPLTGSRNSMVNRRYYVELLKPYLYKQVIDFILQSYVHRSVRIPMLPADYYGLERYDFRHSSQILSLAEKYNHSGNKIDFSAEEIDLLKDKENMVQFLVLVNFQRDGETTNLISIKSKLLSGKLDIGKFSGNLGQVLGGAAQDRDRLNAKVEKYNLSDAEVEKETGVTSHQLRGFRDYIGTTFKYLLDTHFGGKLEIQFLAENNGLIAAALQGDGGSIAFNVREPMVKQLITEIHVPEVQEKLMEIITHEMTHQKEDKEKWGSHETDEEHDSSFMRIQRLLLRDMLRAI